MWANLLADDSLEKYFSVFYNNSNEYKKWYQLDKNDYFKDIFIELYHLPKIAKRTLNSKVEIKTVKSLSKNEEYGYLYLDVSSKVRFETVFYGIRKGEIIINGVEKGAIRINSDTGYANLSGSFEKGIFFVLIKIKERMNNVPVVAISNVSFKNSQDKGFSKNGIFSVKLTNVDKGKDNTFSSLYEGFCFPFSKGSGRDLFFVISRKEKNVPDMEHTFLNDIYTSIYIKNDKENLLKKGFTEEDIIWWKDKLLAGEVCKYE